MISDLQQFIMCLHFFVKIVFEESYVRAISDYNVCLIGFRSNNLVYCAKFKIQKDCMYAHFHKQLKAI